MFANLSTSGCSIEKLLISGELAQALKQETAARQQAERRAEQAEQRITELMNQLENLRIDPDEKIQKRNIVSNMLSRRIKK